MKQSIQWPLRTESENAYRGGNWHANHRRSKTQRDSTRLVLASQLVRRPLVLEGAGGERVANAFLVVLVRISAGELDDDNLRGALKAVRDEVADWIGLDDRDARVRFAYQQQRCKRGEGATRVEIEDLHEPTEERCKVVGANPSVLGAASAGSLRGRPRRGAVQEVRADLRGRALLRRAEGGDGDGRGGGDDQGSSLPVAPGTQERLRFPPVYALLPWDQDGSGDPVLTELDSIDGEAPPETLEVRVPKGVSIVRGGASIRIVSPRLTMFRHRWRNDDLGGDVWVYLDERPRDARGDERTRDER